MKRLIITLAISALVTSCKSKKKTDVDASKAEFVLTDCELTYKGKPIPLGEPIEEWVKVFGEYDRHFGQRTYIWDHLGIGIENDHILSRDEHVSDSLRKHDEFLIFFSNLESPIGKQGELKFITGMDWYKEGGRDPEKYIYPLKTYDKVVSVQGSPIQKGFSLEDINYYREKGDDLKPFYKEGARYERNYEVGDQGYYDQNYWGEDELADSKKCRYYFKAYYTNYELEFIEVIQLLE